MRMTATRRIGRATAGWSFASNFVGGMTGRCCPSMPGGSYRPAFDTISVRTVSVDGQIRIEAPAGVVKIEQGAPAFPV